MISSPSSPPPVLRSLLPASPGLPDRRSPGRRQTPPAVDRAGSVLRRGRSARGIEVWFSSSVDLRTVFPGRRSRSPGHRILETFVFARASVVSPLARVSIPCALFSICLPPGRISPARPISCRRTSQERARPPRLSRADPSGAQVRHGERPVSLSRQGHQVAEEWDLVAGVPGKLVPGRGQVEVLPRDLLRVEQPLSCQALPASSSRSAGAVWSSARRRRPRSFRPVPGCRRPPRSRRTAPRPPGSAGRLPGPS